MAINNESNNKEYISKINLVQDYIENNLDQNLTLDKLAQIVNFSPYYFHRLFKNYTKESLYSYIKRLRLEKAAFLLLTDKKQPITQIALNTGFANQASFAKAFKKYYDINASDYRLQRCEHSHDSKNGQIEGNDGKDSNRNDGYNDIEKKTNKAHEILEIIKPYKIRVENVPSKETIYIRYTGKYKQDTDLFTKLFNQLYKWAFARDLVNCETEWLVVYHDIGNLTEDDKLRMSVCMTVDKSVMVEGKIGKMIIAGGKYAIGNFILDYTQYQQAWNYMINKWLPESGFKPDDKPVFELYPRNKEDHNTNKRVVDIYIPVLPR